MPDLSPERREGALAIVLHTHMPYVEGFGTWPFGEEWLWEAMAGSYLPLLDLLDEGAPLTLSLTPVLCDQLEADGCAERFTAFLDGVRRDTHAQDATGLRSGGHEQLASEVERSWGDYERALRSLDARGGDLLGALAKHVQWTSSATHAVLPLLASDAGIRAQVHGGVRSHRRRFDSWHGGFWLPECAYAPWLLPSLHDAGVTATCVELTNALGWGASGHLRPMRTDEGVLLVPIDRATISLVWSDQGYPAAGAYRDYHHHTIHHHNPWNNAGEPYEHGAALALAEQHAADFVARACARLNAEEEEAGGGLLVCALDTELLGHWWYEGVDWLRAVVAECSRQGLELVRLDDGLAAVEPLEPQAWAASSQALCSWGKDGDLSTWSGPLVADMAFATRAAELEVLAHGSEAGEDAVRELLALQSSDWAFMVSRELAGPYPRRRFDGHLGALRRALDGEHEHEHATAELRNLAALAGRRSLSAF